MLSEFRGSNFRGNEIRGNELRGNVIALNHVITAKIGPYTTDVFHCSFTLQSEAKHQFQFEFTIKLQLSAKYFLPILT